MRRRYLDLNGHFALNQAVEYWRVVPRLRRHRLTMRPASAAALPTSIPPPTIDFEKPSRAR